MDTNSVSMIVSMISSMLIGVSTVCLAIVAILGLRTWRKELTGRAQFQLARDLISHSHRFKEEFRRARIPVFSTDEYATRRREENETQETSAVLDERYAMNRRLERLVEIARNMRVLEWEAGVLLKKDDSTLVSEVIERLWHCYAKLGGAVDEYYLERLNLAQRRERYPGEQDGTEDDYVRQLRREIFAIEGDDLSKQVDSAINQLRSALRRYVK